jgi:hypothetical protein
MMTANQLEEFEKEILKEEVYKKYNDEINKKTQNGEALTDKEKAFIIINATVIIKEYPTIQLPLICLIRVLGIEPDDAMREFVVFDKKETTTMLVNSIDDQTAKIFHIMMNALTLGAEKSLFLILAQKYVGGQE